LGGGGVTGKNGLAGPYEQERTKSPKGKEETRSKSSWYETKKNLITDEQQKRWGWGVQNGTNGQRKKNPTRESTTREKGA